MSSNDRPTYGRRLMPSVLDELAKENPSRLFAAIPKSSDVEQGFVDITVADAARCVNFMAQWIEDRFGKSQRFETISYIGIADLRGPLIFQAAVKCGYKLLLPSPRNPPPTNVSLMKQTESTKLLFAAEVRPLVKPVQGLEPRIRLEMVPSFDDMMRSVPKHYPYEKTYNEAKNEPAVVLHSSGSTGLPKPVIMTHGSFSVLDNEHNLPSVPGRRKRDWTMWSFQGEGRVYTAFPFFHLGGFVMHTVATVFGNTSIVMAPPNMIPDGTLLKSVMMHQKLRALLLPPAVIEQILHDPEGIDLLKTLDFVTYGGASLNRVIGDQLVKVVEIYSPYGSTESYPLPELVPAALEDWEWHEFNPIFKHEMQPHDSSEGTYELVIIAGESAKETSAVYHNLPGIGKFYTKDLFTRHPEKSQLFKYYGRKDDIIVLANGEKFNPVPLEINIQAHPSLKGALVVGNRRTQAALLIEPHNPLNEEMRVKLIEELQPLIERSNALVAGQGHIYHEKIICAHPDKPFLRTGKGTIIRKMTEEVYLNEIENLYSTNSGGNIEVELKPTLKPHYETTTVDEFLRRIISASFPAGATIGGNEDFFAHGLDSVQTLEIVSSLKHNLEDKSSKSAAWISVRTIFHNPTINDLSRLIRAFLNEGIVPGADSDNDRAKTIDGIVATYVHSLPRNSTVQSGRPHNPSIIAVVGSTGYLGSHLVAKLLRTPTVSRIYCLNRSSKTQAQEKQGKALYEIDGSLALPSDKLEYYTIELGKPKLGMAPDEYQKVASEAGVIVYNAWRLDFGLSIRSFEPFLRATRDIVELASSNNIHIVFVSSMSSVTKMATKMRVLEAPINDALAPVNIGYGQSKHAAERILTAANNILGIPVSIVRVCQIGGSSTGSGKWVDQSWVSALVRTAKTIECIPTHAAVVDWVAVDTAAEMLRDFIVRPAHQEAQFYHISHPEPLPWDSVVDILCDLLHVTKVVPLKEWVDKLRTIQGTKAAFISTMPALAMLDFFDILSDGAENSTYATANALTNFKGNLHVLDRAIVEGWLRSWVL
ncbi:acetyl-CoA synthetase-like protein [Whalleya microplaca]|nr:acetyl-CoA synthetase-like protein [Whalleya microplaca]